MKYYYEMVEEDGNFLWRIMETQTEQKIEDHMFEDDAKEHLNFLTKGGAFDGWTPSYILKEF